MEQIIAGYGDGELSEALDWRGRPATARHGGPKTAFFILTNQGLWNVANLAVASNLVLYFRQVLHMSNATAANNVTNWIGTSYILALLGGFLSDSHLGRFWTCVIFQIIHVVGLVLLGLSVTVPSLSTYRGSEGGATEFQTGFFFVAIYIVAVGTGGLLPAFRVLGADQYDSPQHRTTFFTWFVSFTSIGSIVANTLLVYLENSGRWALGFWLANVAGAAALAVFVAGVPHYRHYRKAANPFVRAARVFVAAARKCQVAPPEDPAELYELGEKDLIQQGCRKLPHTPGLHWLDKAAVKVNDYSVSSATWRLCSVTHVEEIKRIVRVLPILVTLIPFSAVCAQTITLFVEQAAMMDRRVSRQSTWQIPPASMSVLAVISVFATTFLYPYTLVPISRSVTLRPEGLSSLQRLGFGMVTSAGSMALAAVVESKRLDLAARDRQMSVWWLAPQQVILGIAELVGIVGIIDFFYSEAPHSMRGLMSSLAIGQLALGNYVSTLLVSATVHFTTAGGRPGWISPDLNDGHLDYFYWLLVVIILVDALVFVVVAVLYRRNEALITQI